MDEPELGRMFGRTFVPFFLFFLCFVIGRSELSWAALASGACMRCNERFERRVVISGGLIDEERRRRGGEERVE